MTVIDDERCRQHDKEITQLGARFDSTENDMKMVVDRLQKLVDQYHEQNLTMERLSGAVQRLASELSSIHDVLKADHVTRAEFSALKRIVYWVVGIIGGALTIWAGSKLTHF